MRRSAEEYESSMQNRAATQQNGTTMPERTQTAAQAPEHEDPQVMKSVNLGSAEQQEQLLHELGKADIHAEAPSPELAPDGLFAVAYSASTPEELSVADAIVDACAGRDAAAVCVASLPNEELGKLFKESMAAVGIDVPVMRDADNPDLNANEVLLLDGSDDKGLLRAWVVPKADPRLSTDRAGMLATKTWAWWRENGESVPVEGQYEAAKADLGPWWQETVYRTSSTVELPESMRVRHITYDVPESDFGARALTGALASAGVEYQACGWETIASGAVAATFAVTEAQLPAAEKAIEAFCKSTEGISLDKSFDISPLETHMDLDRAIGEAKAVIEGMVSPVQTIGLDAAKKVFAPDKGPR